MSLIFWIISIIVPPTISALMIPGLNVNAGTVVGFIALLLTAIFLIRALSDALVLSDIVADVIVRQLGIREERSLRRAARDAIYVVAIVLVATALYTLLGTLGEIGKMLTTATMYVALGIILVLIYDIGRIVYRVIERRAESVADRLAKMAEKSRNRKWHICAFKKMRISFFPPKVEIWSTHSLFSDISAVHAPILILLS